MPTKRGNEARRAVRLQEVMTHRRAGLSYTEIGQRLGISKSEAHRLTRAALAEYAVRTEEDVAEHIRLQLARLDAALAAMSKRLADGSLEAIDRLLKIEARRAALLGLDAPARIAPTNPRGDAEYTGGGLGISGLLAEAHAAAVNRQREGD